MTRLTGFIGRRLPGVMNCLRVYLTWMRPAIFATQLVTNLDKSAARRDVGSVGAQIDLRFTMLSRLDMTLSLGYAVGTGEGVDSTEEYMISLKIM